MIFLGADGNLYDDGMGDAFNNQFRNFTMYDEGAGGGQTIEVVGQRDIGPDLAAEYARQLLLQQQRGQIIGYTPTGEPIYQYFIGGEPTAGVGEQTMGTVATTGVATEDAETDQDISEEDSTADKNGDEELEEIEDEEGYESSKAN